MALSSHLLQFPIHTSSPGPDYVLFYPSPLQSSSPIFIQKTKIPLIPIALKVSARVRCLTKSSTEEDRWSESESFVSDGGDGGEAARDDTKGQHHQQRIATSYGDSLSLGIREPVYEVCFFCVLFIWLLSGTFHFLAWFSFFFFFCLIISNGCEFWCLQIRLTW